MNKKQNKAIQSNSMCVDFSPTSQVWKEFVVTQNMQKLPLMLVHN